MRERVRAADERSQVKLWMTSADNSDALSRGSLAERKYEENRVAVMLRPGIADVSAPRAHPAGVALVLLHLCDHRNLATLALEDQHIVRAQVGRVTIGQVAVSRSRDDPRWQLHPACPQQHRDQLRVGVQDLHGRLMFDSRHD
jgi:hypothetical protein